MILEVLSIVVICVLFIHLGLGEAIANIIKIDFVLLRCVKCLTFWSVLLYLVIYSNNILNSLLLAFISAYIALWLELLLSKIADIYEKWQK